MTKLLVATGIQSSGQTDLVEIIDLLNSTVTSCIGFPKFPFASAGGQGLFIDDHPLICANEDGAHTNCYSFSSGIWKYNSSMNFIRNSFAMTKSPFKNNSLLVTGGGPLVIMNVDEAMVEGHWDVKSISLQLPIREHCMVFINSSTVMVLGGFSGHVLNSTYTLNTEFPPWVEGPQMQDSRAFHSCGLVPNSALSTHLSIIVAGGTSGNMASVEILDQGSNQWRRGPDLPIGSTYNTMVAHPLGGIIVLGGKSLDLGPLDKLFYLPHAGPNAQWQELPQKLSVARALIVAVLVPDEVASFCDTSVTTTSSIISTTTTTTAATPVGNNQFFLDI